MIDLMLNKFLNISQSFVEISIYELTDLWISP